MNTSHSTTSSDAGLVGSRALGHALARPALLGGRSLFDWLFALLVVGGAAYAFRRYGAAMDIYETSILAGAVPALIALGWFWGPIRPLVLGVGAASLIAIALYARTTDAFGADLAAGEKVFWLKYFLSSQSAIMWMSCLLYTSPSPRD